MRRRSRRSKAKETQTQKTQRAANNANGPVTSSQHGDPAPLMGYQQLRCWLIAAAFALFAALCVFCVESFFYRVPHPARFGAADPGARAGNGCILRHETVMQWRRQGHCGLR
jgi:hypothetical protein